MIEEYDIKKLDKSYFEFFLSRLGTIIVTEPLLVAFTGLEWIEKCLNGRQTSMFVLKSILINLK